MRAPNAARTMDAGLGTIFEEVGSWRRRTSRPTFGCPTAVVSAVICLGAFLGIGFVDCADGSCRR